MNVLVVEDDDDKAKDICSFLLETYGIASPMIARSLQSGLRAILSASFDLILLDMTMRNFDRTLEEDGGRPHHFAGREILRQMHREEVSVPVIVVTHFERFGEEAEEMTLNQLKSELFSKYPDYRGTVHYRSNVDEWKRHLKNLCDSII